MVVGSTVKTNNNLLLAPIKSDTIRHHLFFLEQEPKVSVKTLSATANGINKAKLLRSDRCDLCGSQAYVLVQGTPGDLMFCGHHYTAIMNSPSGKSAMDSFAFNTVDDRKNINNETAGL
jgi:hypothetical protein